MSDLMMCAFYAVAMASSLLGMWVGFFLGVYASEVCAFLRKRLGKSRR